MNTEQKLSILADAAKFDVACTSSGSERGGKQGSMGNAVSGGICHSFSSDGRCISLLKVLMSNACAFDCEYCVNRRSNETERATFEPRELADLTMTFYRRNYIEGLFLSSGIVGTPDLTCELMIKTLRILREEYRFRGYIHAKAIPGADPRLIEQIGLLVDRVSVNIELPSEQSLKLLAPDKSKTSILKPMGHIADRVRENKNELIKYRHAPIFAPAGQSTQMIVGATPDSDFKIITLSEALYKKYRLKRVFYSAYLPMMEGKNLPARDIKPPLLREHRLYQADWLLRFYGFTSSELLSEERDSFNPLLDPKSNWAVNNLHTFPIDVNTAPYEMLLRVPGIGVTSAKRIITVRRHSKLSLTDLKKLGVVVKRARYFITAVDTKAFIPKDEWSLVGELTSKRIADMVWTQNNSQTSLFDDALPTGEDVMKCLTGQM